MVMPQWVSDFRATVAAIRREERLANYRRDSLIVETARDIARERLAAWDGSDEPGRTPGEE